MRLLTLIGTLLSAFYYWRAVSRMPSPPQPHQVVWAVAMAIQPLTTAVHLFLYLYAPSWITARHSWMYVLDGQVRADGAPVLCAVRMCL
jgi:hypothetical protein